MSHVTQNDWDTHRLELLTEAADLFEFKDSETELQELFTALSRAFDRPVPDYPVYRRLNKFKAGQWSLLRNIIAKRHLADEHEVKAIFCKVAEVLNSACEKRDDEELQIDIQSEVLMKLLQEMA